MAKAPSHQGRFLPFLGMATLVTGALLACTKSEMQVKSTTRVPSHLSGRVELAGLADGPEGTVTCAAEAKITLHPLGGFARGEAPLANAPLDHGGRFTLRWEDAKVRWDEKTAYELVLEGCPAFRARIVTGTVGQDVTPASTLLAYAGLLANGKLALADVHRLDGKWGRLQSLTTRLDGAADMPDAYARLVASPDLNATFTEVFGMPAVKLKEAPPMIVAVTAASEAEEREGAAFGVSASHWDPAYAVAYVWKADDVVIGTEANVTFTPSANGQGLHTVSLYVGKSSADEPRKLDVNAPYLSRGHALRVRDTFPAKPPALALGDGRDGATAIALAQRALDLRILTGEAKQACESFSALALTENVAIAPLDAAAYTIRCEAESRQALAYTLKTAGDGPKILRLWARDASGNIGKEASTLTVTLDTKAPGAFAFTAPAAATNVATPVVQWTAADKAATYDLTLASDAACAMPLQTFLGLTARSQALAALAEGTYYLCLTATDALGNAGKSAAYRFDVDTTPPGAFTLTAPTDGAKTANPQVDVSWTAASGAAAYEVRVGTGASCSSPTQTHGGLTGLSYRLAPLTDGTHNICVRALDAAGNAVTAGGSGASVEVDATPPAVTLTSMTGGEKLKGGDTVAITWTASDANLGAAVATVDVSDDAGATWANAGTAPASGGTYSWSVPSVNASRHRVRVSVPDTLGNTTRVASTSDITIDSTAPVIASFMLAGGASFVAMPTVAASVSASDDRTGVAWMRWSENAVFADSGWVPFATSRNIVLSAVSGAKTVYLWVKDGAGNVSAPASTNINLDFGTPPDVTIVTPDGNTTYNVGDTVTIAWTCQSSHGLGTPPITAIHYTADDGVTFTPIAQDLPNNDSATSGHYLWTLPAALAGKPFRLTVACQSVAGVAMSAYSKFINTPGWSVFMGDPWRNTTNVSASVANVGGTFFPSLIADAANNIYFVKHHAVMRIDNQTGLVTTFAGNPGDPNSPGCTMATGVNPIGSLMTYPEILGLDASGTHLLILSRNCSALFRIRLSDGQVTQWNSFAMNNNFPTFVTKNRVLLYVDHIQSKLYRVDLDVANAAPVHIMGNGTCTDAPVVEGTAALDSPMRRATNFGCATYGSLIMANPDASRIWVNNYFSVNAFRLDLVNGTYVIAQADTGWDHSAWHCVTTSFDNRLYCDSRGGTYLQSFDLGTETWDPRSDLPVANNDGAGRIAVGAMSDKLLAYNSLNTIQTVIPSPTAPWQYTLIAGKELSVMGNGGPPSGVAFDQPLGIAYNAATQKAFVRNAGHLRVIDLAANPPVAGTLFNGAIYQGYGAMSINPAGDRVAILQSNCQMLVGAFTLSATSLDNRPWFLVTGCPGVPYAPQDGINATNGDAGFPIGTFLTMQAPLYHSNGKGYFSAGLNGGDVFVFASDTSMLTRVAGTAGPGGYDAMDEGAPALGAKLTQVQHLQEDAAGDLLIWDALRLRKITITTEAAQPRIYTVVDYMGIAGITGLGDWYDAHYDEATGYTYYVTANAEVHKAKVGFPDHKFDFTGTTLSGGSPVRIALTPADLLVLQPNKARILRVAP